MAKKSFKDSNPAMQFISVPEPTAPEPAPVIRKHPQVKQTLTAEVESGGGLESGAAAPGREGEKGGSLEQTRQCLPDCKSEKEKKTRRLNLLLQPSVLDDLAKIAHMRRTSLNDLINTVLREYNAANAETIARYDEFFGKGA